MSWYALALTGKWSPSTGGPNVVAAKLSSWPTPQDAPRLFSTLTAFDMISRQLSA